MIGKYKKTKHLGTGTIGETWLVKDINDKKYIAKIISLNKFEEENVEKGVELLENIKGPYIISYITSFKDEDFYVIIKEYCPSSLAHKS